MFRRGHGVVQSDAEAVEWYRLAAKQGLTEAQFNFGMMHEYGHGVPKSNEEALKWHQLAANQGHSTAALRVGAAFENGWSVLQDYRKAHMWYNIGSANGSEGARQSRDAIAAKMTPEEVSEAHAMATTYVSSGYKDSGL